ncbi:MAG TPA: DUF6600 domain-containing protein [Verrucomicrobiae bacterium]|nr:DUF6600 domain-containing protein [Verrucomicrobiae bacterium]
MALALFLPKLALADDDDPPSVVARLAYSQGAVSFQPAGTEDWVDAGINRPITTGDKLWSDQDGRVELQLDASTIRLFHSTGFSFLNLNDNITQVRLSEGTILVRVRHLDDNETYEIDTPNLAFSITRPGIYRVNVDEGGDATSIGVRDGEGQVTGGGASYSVRSHDDAVFSGTDQLSADVQDLSADYDEFDTWSANRDRRWEHSRSAQYVSQDVVGYEDLDDHGDWRDSPEYGHVWYPRVEVADWAPYHYGHWAYIAPWGYTWVDDQPWGFAPFHYGRWVNVEGRWGWIPSPPRAEGVVYVRPVYAPALVAFVGGGGFSVGVAVGGGGGAVGWFPLGPREVYVPSYRVSQRYVENVNISNTTVNRTVINNYYQTTVVNNTRVTNVTYVNQRVPGAVMATSQQAFTSAQPVARNAVRVDARQMASAQVQVRQPAIVPTKQAVLGSARPAEHQPPAAVQQRAVVAKAAPPPPAPSFERRQEAIKTNGGQPLSVTQIRQMQPAAAARTQAAAVRVAPPPRQAPVSVREAPKPSQPVNRSAAQGGQGSVAGRPGQPGQPQPGQPQNNPGNRPAAVNNEQPGNRPAERGTATQPNDVQPNNRPADRPVSAPNNDRTNTTPPTNRPADRSVTQPNSQPQPNSRPPATNDRPPSAQPNNRPADRPVTRPNEQPATRTAPNEQPAARPAPNERPADRPVTRPNEQPAPRPAPAERPAERSAPPPAAQKQQQQKQQEKAPKEKEKDKEKPPKG